MAEQFLDGAQVPGILQHVGGEGMTKLVRVQMVFQAARPGGPAQPLLDAGR